MPLPYQRNTSAKQRQRKTPSGRISVTFQRSKGDKHICAICSTTLQAVARRSKQLKRLTKTQKRPERKFAGVLCANCVQSIIKQKTRLETGAISREDVPLALLKYLDRLSA